MRLQRFAELMTGNTAAFKIDNLKYDYAGNRLTKVTEEEIGKSDGYPYLASHNTIEYDNSQNNGNGNMTKHLDKGISSIQYNYLNLPRQITQNAQMTNYVYRADGTKVKKLFEDIETNYLDGFQYKSTKPSEAGSNGGPILINPNEVAEIKLRIIPTAEGYFDALSNQYIYNYTDHLGNVRLSYTDTNKDGIIQPRQYNNPSCTGGTGPFDPPMCIDNWKPGEIVEVNSYYPFGLMHNYTATTQNAYQYKYNGKELQETGMYDYGARFYMPEIGRWGVVDALSEQYRRHSPYNYAINNPIRFIDPDGNSIQTFSGEAAQQVFSALKSSMSNTDGESAWPPRNGAYNGESYSDKNGSWSWNEQYSRWDGVNGSKNVMLIEPGTEVCCNLENTKVMTYTDALVENFKVPMSVLDGPIKMMGGAGDVFGIWELLGIALGASDSNAKYAMLPLMVVKGQGDDALKMLNAEKGLLIQANQRKGIVKAEYLFENLNDAKNLGSTILGPSKVRMYNENGKWIGWENKSGNQVYWKHGDWGQGKGSSTFPHINYIIDGQKGHFYLKDKMINRGEWESFKTYYKNYFNP